ncbi:hypothetical protein COX08_04230 [Candidatus Beckwithbacteria bacterium CG23_combo_of_CG06-09_8_20_14_all_34_8]|uniref:Membrane protein 6-pyruvoyl-tetrahydropterin synthase-related domain-containing protein n=1 Tax=Candidatus Beckwithbacteria bacterium CG23_combo_of_CG06-09_8_20_14_all_34_8 TaxID=1974497 RepID=A0A2H0B586_9BACT|nr:MAG: hypothetical protein COX08_04230 [Candidatus Beckwithbacteria bacterium CG23_combo_of_CG06-09_8_20_14_all_34_8]
MWQESFGLGNLGGMGHAAELIRQIIILPFVLILPNSLIRYLWQFGTLLLGGLGARRIISYLKLDSSIEERSSNCNIGATFGAIFYLLNIGTLQVFYLPQEPFTAFFGFLPWLLYYDLKVMRDTRKPWLRLIVLHLLATTIAFVQTLFLVYMVILVIFTLLHIYKSFITKDKIRTQFNNSFTTSIKLWLLIIIVNLFWLLPVVYFTITNSQITVNSKINQIATQETNLRNQAFGTLGNIATLRGYWFDYTDFNKYGDLIYLLDYWQHYLNQIPLIGIQILFILFFLLGLILLVRSNNYWKEAIIVFLMINTFMLLGNQSVFGFITDLMQKNVPLFSQIFRSPFTKWIIPLSLIYSIFLGWGINWVYKKVSSFSSKLGKIIPTSFIILIIIYAWPTFNGHFFYQALKQNIPTDYFELFKFFDKVDSSTRIATLPQHYYWGWEWYKWPQSIGNGYRGSGFLWYGLKQPVLDRAFDVWSSENEQYYWELSRALNTQDTELLTNVLNKYDVDWILLDRYLVNRSSDNPFEFEKIDKWLLGTPNIVKEKTIGGLIIYTVNKNSYKQQFISGLHNVPVTDNKFIHSWEDRAYNNLGDYKYNQQKNPQYIYPFPSLFTNKLQSNIEFGIKNDVDTISLISNHKLSDVENYNLESDNIVDSEAAIPAKISWKLVGKDKLKLDILYLLPKIYFGYSIYEATPSSSIELSLAKCQSTQSNCTLTLNYRYNYFALQASSKPQIVLLSTKLPNVFGIYSGSGVELWDEKSINLRDIKNQFVYKSESTTNYLDKFDINIPKVDLNGYNQNILEISEYKNQPTINCRPYMQGTYSREIVQSGILYSAQHATSCDNYFLNDLEHNQSYIINITSANPTGMAQRFGLQIPSAGRSELDTFLSFDKDYYDNWIIVPQTSKFNKGYGLFFETISFGKEINNDILSSIKLWPFPYNFIKSIFLINKYIPDKVATNVNTLQVSKKGLWLYRIKVENLQQNISLTQQTKVNDLTLKLSQAYHSGWIGLAKTHNGWRLLPHVKINNWANGWEIGNLNGNNTIYLIFWPQILEYIGLAMLGITILTMFLKHKKH